MNQNIQRQRTPAEASDALSQAMNQNIQRQRSPAEASDALSGLGAGAARRSPVGARRRQPYTDPRGCATPLAYWRLWEISDYSLITE